MSEVFNGQDLLEYLEGFSGEAYRKQVLDTIISNKLIEKFLDAPENKKVLDFFTRRLSEDIAAIIQIALAWDASENSRTEKIIQLGNRSGVILSALKEISAQMEEGRKHVKKMKKEK